MVLLLQPPLGLQALLTLPPALLVTLLMRGAVVLLVLFCLSGAWAQGESGGVRENDITQQGLGEGGESWESDAEQLTNQPDIWTEL
ncbi:unnamed protein product [Coregonus sp. 'balchen']|nr:unnamed protein product [Coregonus sp. 'balchen']